jgi:DNA-binding response OmpR family regulator
LYVEDDLDIQAIARLALENVAGFTVHVCSSGEAAVREAAAFAPDLVLLDVMMPGSDGLTVCRLLKENPATQHIPVLLLTARAGKADREAGLAAGADDYITKPFSPQRLVDKVNEMLGARS